VIKMGNEDEVELREKQKTFFDLLERAMSLASQAMPTGTGRCGDNLYRPFAHYCRRNGMVIYGYVGVGASDHYGSLEKIINQYGGDFEAISSNYDTAHPIGNIAVPSRLKTVAEGK
jgi:hypothetical protein